MPVTLTIGFFVFGAVLVLIALMGGRFQIFSVVVSSTTASFTVRIIAFVLGAIFLSLATYMGISEVFAVPSDVPPTIDAPIVVSEPQSPPSASQPSPQPIQPTQTNLPVVPTDTPTPSKPNPTEFVISYWQNISDGNLESAWEQLSPRFRQVMHDDNYYDYVRGYQEMNLCRIIVSDLNLTKQENYFAVVTAHLTYYAGSQCHSSEYDFEMWLIYDGITNSYYFDKNIIR